MSISDFKYKDEEGKHISFYKDRHNTLPHKKWWILLQIILYILIIFLAEKLIIRYCFQGSTVYGISMSPTLEEKDVVLLNKLCYCFDDPQRFDIVVVVIDKQEDINYVKRVIGMPGETVQIKEGKVFINGEPLTDDTYCNTLTDYAGIASEPLKLGENEYFVLGDNRNESLDSRRESVGLVQRGQILGKAIYRLRPFSKMGALK